MLFERPRTLFGGLRFQLAALNAVVILALVFTTFAALRQGLSWALHREIDAQLREDLEEVGLILDRFWPDWAAIKEELDRKAVSHKAHAWFARIFDVDGRPLLATVGAPDILAPLELASQPFTRDSIRLIQQQRSKPSRGFLVRVGCSQESIKDDVANLTRILAVAGAAFLVIAPLSGWLLAGRATRPIAAIAHIAARTRPGHLQERVPLRGAGDELDQLAGTLNGLLDRLGEHLDRQRVFVANAAHELRTPLAALRTTAEIALSQNRNADEYREILTDIIEASGSLVTLVNQLLLLAEGEAGPIRTPTRVALDRVGARVVEMFAGIAEQREVTLTFESVPVFVLGNEGFLRQVVSNLIDNALKFTPEGGSVKTTVAVEGDEAVLRVEDTGAGISVEDQSHLFERFFRANRSRQRTGGTGLGLSICKALVSAHGGRIHIHSQLGQGTTVLVHLPACPVSNLTKM